MTVKINDNVDLGLLSYLSAVFLTIALISCGPSIPSEVHLAMKELPGHIDFNIHVKPILSDRCFTCHGPDESKRKAGLRLDIEGAAFAELRENKDKYAIKPGHLEASLLYHRINSSDPEIVMPPPVSGLELTTAEKAILTLWIKQGAHYKKHWSFISPEKPTIPIVRDEGDKLNPIDNFIREKLSQKGWSAAKEATKEDLLRRVSFDVTGLPPTIEEMDDFLVDTDENAYEKVVDRLLASPHYGERMAVKWLDLARFADTHGYTVDRYRDMSPWRDWVIQSYNRNMPFDDFLTWQLAGDLLPNATDEQILATGFNRNHQQNMEGGIVPEEFRVEYVADRTNTLGKAFLGLTTECARCHDHKYDPITQKNYYEFFSFFNNVNEAGQISFDDAIPGPTLVLSKKETREKIDFINQQITVTSSKIANANDHTSGHFSKWKSGKYYRNSLMKKFPDGLVAHYDLNNKNIANSLPPFQKGIMRQQHVESSLHPILVQSRNGNGVKLDGDAWLELKDVGVYDRATPFSIGIWVNIPQHLTNGVLFHKGIGAALYNFRGYHLAIKDNRLEVLMARTAPYNAIIKYANDVPRDQWIHLAITYDGSSKAAGLKVFLNGKEQSAMAIVDNLYKSILFNYQPKDEIGLQIGARWRGIGAKGVVVDDISVFNRSLSALEVEQLYDPKSIKRLVDKSPDELSSNDIDLLKEYYISTSGQFKADLVELEQLFTLQNNIQDTLKEIMVIREMDHLRNSHILNRGLYDQPGETVTSNTPGFLPPMPSGAPKNRLGLTQWLTSEDHPLTSRVAVNRIWQQFFGHGLVETTEDFGSQGSMPTHPELLDWLAVEFIESEWDIKHMIKLIVMSATYKQASIPDPRIASMDPKNKFLSHGPASRLSAEMLRDNALSASNLLVKHIGGPSVRPYQPDGLWKINGATYIPGTGQDLYRRSLYTFWKRTIPHPTQGTFDAPDRSVCTVRRQKTSTPLQALVLLNDPTFVEASKVIGEEISKSPSLRTGIVNAFRQLTGRFPSEGEIELLLQLQVSEKLKFTISPEKTIGWLHTGAYELDNNFAPEILAANAVVANTIINADASIIKR